MIAIPIKREKQDSAVSTLFGKSKWFAFIDENDITIEKNELQSGRAVIEDFVKKGVTKIVFQSMGGNPFMLLQKNKIECFYSGKERILLPEVLLKLEKNELLKVDTSNMADYIEQGTMHKNKDHENTHHHEHHHQH